MKNHLDGLVICGFDERFRDEILKLHKESFIHLGKKDYEFLIDNLIERLDNGSVVLAVYGQNLLGFGSFAFMKEDTNMKNNLKWSLENARHPEYESSLRDYMVEMQRKFSLDNFIEYIQESAAAFGHTKNEVESAVNFVKLLEIDEKKYEVMIEYFTNNFLKSNIQVNNEDMLLSCLALREGFRRMGIGQILAEKRISIARENGALAVYVTALEGSGTEQLYSKLGFSPIIRLGPMYQSGHSSLCMGLELQV